MPTPGITLDVPILLYHHVGRPGAPASVYNVTRAEFEEQMAFLAAHNFHTVSLDAILAALRGGPSLPLHPIVLTFDDGYRDAYTTAFPVLKQYGFQGTFFVPTHYVDMSSAFLTWAEVTEMHDAGMLFGSHTLNHARLTRLSPAATWFQLVQSRQELEAHLGTPVTMFAYPYTTTDAAVIAQVERAGYLAAVTVGPDYRRTFDRRYQFKRATISGADGLGVFISRLPRAWLADQAPQQH
jgi:peptidoglycan/xylan/chitin deacetylase (PgdA/CDA1 family)